MEEKETIRNRPTEKGRNEDPNIRDASGQQPGVNTMSSSDTDEANQSITKTTADNNRRPAEEDAAADRDLDEAGN